MEGKKKLLLFGLIFVMLVASVSAVEWDNIREYDESSKTLTISNSFLKIWPLGEVAEITLITPQVNRVIRGKDRLVAEFRINSTEDYERVFKNMEFYDLNNESLEISRTFKYKYAEYYDVVIPDYEMKCAGIHDNGSLGADCRRVEVGSHINVERRWIDLDTEDTFFKGEKNIGVFADVSVGERVEWIPTLFGVRIPEWAEWTESLSEKIILYFDFSNSSINGTTVLDQVGTYDDVDGVFADPNINGNFSGIIGSAVGIFGETGSGRDDWIQIFSAAPRRPVNWTFNGWFNSNVSAAQGLASRLADNGNDAPREWRLWYGDGTSNPGSLYEFEANAAAQILPGNERLVDEWIMLTIVHNDTGMYFYENGTEVASVISALTVGVVQNLHLSWDCSGFGSCQEFSGRIDEVGYWNRSLSATEVSQLFNNKNPPSFNPDPNPFNMSVDLSSPVNATAFTESFVEFNATLFPGNVGQPTKGNLTNATLIIWYDGNDTIFNETTNLITGNETNSTIWNITGFPSGGFRWNVLGCAVNGTDVLCVFNETNSTFTVDNEAPVITILFPNSTVPLGFNGLNLTINFTITDPNTDSCSVTYAGSTFNITCAENTSIIIESAEETNFTFFANDTLGNEATFVQNISFFVFQGNSSFDNETIEGSLSTFIQNVTLTGVTIDAITFVYESSTGSPTLSTSGNETILTMTNFLVPGVAADSNRQFFWSLNLSNGLIVNLQNETQRVLNFQIGNCTDFGIPIFNFTMVDEELQNQLTNTTMEVSLNAFAADDSLLIFNFSEQTSLNPFAICISQAVLEGNSFLVDVIVRYSTGLHATEHVNIDNSILTNGSGTNNITLFDLNLSDSTEFQITFTGDDFLPVQGALVFIDRQYVAENTFKTVEIPITDSNGQTVAHLVRNDVVYNMRIVKGGVVLASFDRITAFCEDFVIGDCKISLTAESTAQAVFEYNEDLGITFSAPTFDLNASLVSFSFTSVDGTSKTVLMNVTRSDVFGNRTICSDTLTAAGGTLQCNTGNVTDTTIKATVSSNGIEVVIKTFDVANLGFGVAGIFVFFLISINLIFMFSGSKSGVMIAIVFSFAIGTGIGFIQGGLIGLGAGGLWIMLIVGIALWKLNKGRVQ
ncbi:hypothetical protein LCGC14_1357780 [marine sediment metagenome]|uniref:LamG-like jellyroll fold domain-containing protein n=1 Tax=marine sediment metagenome TaxID=412755 RepID=A0A0F9MPD9_9ZZZZ